MSYMLNKCLRNDWKLVYLSMPLLRYWRHSYIYKLSVNKQQQQFVRLTKKKQLRKPNLNQHMPGVVYCDSRFNWVLAPLHPGDSCCSLLHSQMSRSAMSYCDLAVRHSQHQSGVTLGSPSAPDKLWFALQRCLSHWLLQGGASLIICRNDTAERCF